MDWEWTLSCDLLLRVANRQGDDERSALAQFAFCGDDASVPVGDAATDGQADAGPFIFIPAVQALEYGENFLQILFFKPDAVILDGQFALLSVGIFIGGAGKRAFEDASI